jgi:hypothetical protein
MPGACALAANTCGEPARRAVDPITEDYTTLPMATCKTLPTAACKKSSLNR